MDVDQEVYIHFEGPPRDLLCRVVQIRDTGSVDVIFLESDTAGGHLVEGGVLTCCPHELRPAPEKPTMWDHLLADVGEV